MATMQSLLRSCLDKLTEIASSEAISNPNNRVPKYAWTDELGRLRIWVSNIGAHQVRQPSIDYRLSDAPRIRDQAFNLLASLERILLELQDLNSCGDEDGEESLDDEMKTLYEGFESESDSSLEVQDIYQTLTDTISNLYELAIIIRQPSDHDQPQGLDSRNHGIEDEGIKGGLWICVSHSCINFQLYRD